MILTMIGGVTNKVQAAVIHNVSDNSSLTAAINNAVDGDTINFTNNVTITSEVDISKALNIEGNNHIITVPVPGLDDSGIYNTNPSTFRVFNINVPGKTVEINDLTIKGGCISYNGSTATTGKGAGILNNTGTVLELNNIDVSNSRAYDSSSYGSGTYGGGIVNNGGTVYLKDSNISRNAAEFGGGFLNTSGSTMFIENSTISENRSTSAQGGGGGGQNNGTLYVNNSTFSNNKSTELGGAINNRPGSVAYFVNSTFTGNVAYGTGFDGGAIANNGGTSTALNCLFAYNYQFNGTNYVLNDISDYSSCVPINSYYCIFHAPMGATKINNVIGNTQYSGNADGSDNSIFTNGINALVLNGNGQTIGTKTIFQPILAKANGINTPTALLKTGSFALFKGAKTGFTDGNGSPVIGYNNGTNWVDLIGSNSTGYEVTTDQDNISRTATPTVGALETASSTIYMLKVNAATGGTVNGGTIYGDAYASGTNVTLTAIPNDGYMFSEWDYVDGGTGTASTSNPYPLSVTQNTTLIPVFRATSTKSVTYIDNGSTGGTVPSSFNVSLGSQVTVSGNTGHLVKSGYNFTGWNTEANGSGTAYAAGETFNLTVNLALYAQWAPVTVPDAPTNVRATAGNASASVTWTAPASDGGSPITDYLVDVYKNTTLVNTVNTGSTTTSAAITGLTNGTAYTFDVKAVNSVGNSAASSATNAVTPTAPSNSHENGGSPGSGTGSSSGATITANVVDESNGNINNSSPVASINAMVAVNTDGTDTISVKQSDAVVIKQPDGSIAPFEDYSKIGYIAPSNVPVIINSDGTVQVSNLVKGSSYDVPVTYDMGNGQKIMIGNMHISVDGAGNVNMTSNLIDPYGTLTDSVSGKVISGVNVTLYYADTSRNIAAGIIPNTAVKLPAINGFKPNNNQNPQTTDIYGTYGFLVYPNTDYYIVAVKEDYDTLTSPTISVADKQVKYSAKMNHPVTGILRLGGESRVDTAIELAKSEFSEKVKSVVLATADNYPDALVGSVLAYQQNAPILLVGDSQSDQDKVIDYLKSYADTSVNVFILGQTAVVSEAFVQKVNAAGFYNIKRLGGYDRYETDAKIVDYLDVPERTPVVVALGENYPDALSVSSAASINQFPILLVGKDGFNDLVKAEFAKIKPSKVYIIGGTGAISDGIKNQIADLTSLANNNIIRLGGIDRYETSLAVGKYFNLSGQSICIATGNNFPDALAGSIYASNYNAPVILADKTLSDDQINYLKSRKLSGVTIFGGDAVISQEIQQELSKLVGQ